MTRRAPRVLLMVCDGTIGNQRREAASTLQSKRVERWGVSEQIRDSLALSFSTLQSSPLLTLSPYRLTPPLSPRTPHSPTTFTHPTPRLLLASPLHPAGPRDGAAVSCRAHS